MLGRAKKAGRDVGRMVVKRAEDLGLEFDGASRGYVYIEEMKSDEELAGENGESEAA